MNSTIGALQDAYQAGSIRDGCSHRLSGLQLSPCLPFIFPDKNGVGASYTGSNVISTCPIKRLDPWSCAFQQHGEEKRS